MVVHRTDLQNENSLSAGAESKSALIIAISSTGAKKKGPDRNPGLGYTERAAVFTQTARDSKYLYSHY
jgi:hypothetical protein